MVKFMKNEIAEVKVLYSHVKSPSQQVQISGSKEVVSYIRPFWENIDYCESMCVVLLSRGLRVLGFNWLSRGGTGGTVVDVKMVAQIALLTNSYGLILVHNHPSGNLRPSEADKSITEKVKRALQLFEINLLDHIIISSESQLSFADEGLL